MKHRSQIDTPLALPRNKLLDEITRDPAVKGGRAVIRGLHVTVGMVVGQIAAGNSIDGVLLHYTCLERDDALQTLRYAAWLSQEREFALATG